MDIRSRTQIGPAGAPETRVRAATARRPRLTYAATAIALAAAVLLSVAPVAGAAPPDMFPSSIPLPNGFRPEGVATGRGPVLYAGSLANGAIYRANLRTGEGEVLYPGAEGRVAVGLFLEARRNRLFVAGGPTGMAYVHDGCTGKEIEMYELAGPGAFVNDVVVTRAAAYFTNSFSAVFYRLPLAPNGALPDPSLVREVSLSGDWEQVDGFNANGIEATADGAWLVIVNSTTGTLYRVDPETGEATAIDLGGEMVTAGDGILLEGRTLYVVRNRLNQIAVVELADDLLSGTLLEPITDSAFDVPTTVAGFGNALYAVNARFGVMDPDAEYDVIRVLKH
jgi:sugar lactone lactonase YvrE